RREPRAGYRGAVRGQPEVRGIAVAGVASYPAAGHPLRGLRRGKSASGARIAAKGRPAPRTPPVSSIRTDFHAKRGSGRTETKTYGSTLRALFQSLVDSLF